MEKGKSVSDPHDQVRILQEKVRELELQLSKKSSTSSRNGISETSNSSNTVETEEDEGLVPVYDVDLSPKTWLVSSRVDSRTEKELFSALLSDGALLEKTLYSAIRNAEQERRNNIDTRTFTRPKKRLGRPSLELLDSLACLSKPSDSGLSWAKDANCTELDNMTCSLLETSLINSMYSADASTASDITSHFSVVNKKQKVAPQLERRRGSLVISENESAPEDTKPNFKHDNGNCLTNHIGNANFANLDVGSTKNDSKNEIDDDEEMDTTLLESADFTTSLIDSALMDPNLMDAVLINSKPKLSTSRIHQLNRTFTPSPPTVDHLSRKASSETLELNQSLNNLNETFVKEDEESPGNKVLNTTFPVEANGSGSQRTVPPLVRPGSTDSGGADDDQLSSTSESSHTSTTRLMSVGDVQHIARLQEQSLVMSTPSQRHIAKLIEYGEDNISPILRAPDWSRSSGGSEIPNGGYLSDHSSRSPLSSLHSSPAGSPFGSSTVLHGSTQVQDSRLQYRPNGVLQRKNTYGLIPPRKLKEEGLRPPAPVTVSAKVSTNTARPTARSGLRPPMIRTGASGSSGLPRPSGTGIPRPSSLSRIPPPKVRSSSQVPRKEWTDECY